MVFTPCMVRTVRPGGGELIRLGHPLLDAYLDLVTARARPNTVLATAFDLKVFFTVIDQEPGEVTMGDVLAFIKAQRAPARAKVVRIEDGEAGLVGCERSSGAWPRWRACSSTSIIRGDAAVARQPRAPGTGSAASGPASSCGACR